MYSKCCMHRIIPIAIVLLISLERYATAQESIPPEVLQKVKQASVFVKVSLGPLDYSGSGFVIQVEGDSVFLVTNVHVVAKPDLKIDGLPLGMRGRDLFELRRIQAAIENLEPQVSVVFNSGTKEEEVIATKTVVLDSVRDIAILKVAKVKSAPVPIPLDVAFRPQETTSVFIFGFPFGEALSKTKGNPAITVGRGAISSVRLDERGEDTVVQIDGALNPGNSGGPVVDAKGRLVGVSVATIRGSGIGFAIPPATLDRILSGGVESVELAPQKTNDDLNVEITLKLVDPFQKVRKVFANCVLGDASLSHADVAKPLEGTRVEFRTAEGKATATWKIAQPKDDHNTVLLQAIIVDENGAERRLPVTKHALKASKGHASQARASSRRRGVFSLFRPLLEDIVRDSFLERLKKEDKSSLLQTMQELSRYDPSEDETKIAAALEKLIKHSDESVREAAARLIGTWGTTANGAAVLKLVDDPVASIRQLAMEALGAWQFADAAEPIAKRLAQTSERNIVKQSLIRIGSRAEPTVVKYLAVAELPVRVAACEILGEIGSKDQSIPALKQLVDKESGLIATRAREAIDRINTRGSTPLVSRLNLTLPGKQKVHVGLPIKQGNMLLTEGAIVLRDSGPAIGIGLVQTGSDTMEFTYLMLTRLPKVNIQSATFSTRRKTVKNRLRVSHDIALGDDELTIEHLYAPEKLPFEDEEFLIQEQTFSPENGRLFLADLSGATPVIVQKSIPLPVAGSLIAINDESTLELADQAVNELIQVNEDVRRFMNGGKLDAPVKSDE